MKNKIIKYIDLFCGIGGFRVAIERVSKRYGLKSKCVFSSDIDKECQRAYQANFGETPFGDIKMINENKIPYHDLLMAGFPCQPFSIIGNGKGFEDIRGTLFFEIARILKAKKPRAFLLENVKQLKGHQKGYTLERIMETLRSLGYYCDYKILNALEFGLPQKRERIFIVGFLENVPFYWPNGGKPMKPLTQILEKNVSKKHFVSDYVRKKRLAKKNSNLSPSIWHENKAGHIGIYPFSCALRANASHNYLLVDGIRRLTPREMMRLQGFPDSFKIVCAYGQTRKQAGNAVPVPVVEVVLAQIFDALEITPRHIAHREPRNNSNLKILEVSK